MYFKIKKLGEQFVLINALDVVTRRISEGGMVRVFNDRGRFEAV